jgi:ABC-2 type transport system ATP-binding protein
MHDIVIKDLRKSFGRNEVLHGIDLTIPAGEFVGLMGPNGAGKSTLIHMMGGFLPPSAGSVTLDGEVVWRNEGIYRRIGLVPEREAMYDVVTGWEFVLANARLHRLPDPEAAARRALATVEMTDTQDRDIGTYSKGMKQRVKMATALVHDPPLLLLDEPFNGMDPRQRLHLMDLLRAMGDEGRTVLFSSHILEEVEQLAERIQVVVAGRHAASGGFREIRQLMTERPHQYAIRSDDDRALAAAIIAQPSASGVQLLARGDVVSATGRRDTSSALHVQATDFAAFVRVLPRLAQEHGIRLYEVTPTDESLESVFSYLVAR